MKNFELSQNDGAILVKTARKIVTEYLRTGKKIELEKEFEESFSFNAGVFVTLNNQKRLRGCIGFPLPDKKLHSALREAAVAAATEDPRFPQVNFDELDNLTFEVTVLSPPDEIVVENTLDYPSKIKVGRDGLVVKAGLNSGLLLPQVPVEHGWNGEEFLGYTCEKAGLPQDFWKQKETKVLKFEGVVFKEETPNGNVIQVRL